MPRARLISPEFWTSEAVVDCPPMTRLLLLGLSTFADDFGALPLRPRTLRMQVFPGDALDDDQVRAMIEELTARGLVRRYSVDGVEYLSIVDWEVHQRVGKRARRRHPAFPSPREGRGPRTAPGEKVPNVSEADEGLAASTPPPDHREPEQSPSSARRAPSPRIRGEKEDAPDDAAHVAPPIANHRIVFGGRAGPTADNHNGP